MSPNASPPSYSPPSPAAPASCESHRLFEGRLSARAGDRFAVVAARFNELVVDRLLSGCLEAFRRHGAAPSAVDVVRVPGSFEIPVAAEALADTGRYAAVVCLGAVIKGATDHYDYVCGEAAGGIGAAARATGVPCVFGVLTCDTMEQALDRAGGKAGNKGAEAAACAVEMADLLARIREAAPPAPPSPPPAPGGRDHRDHRRGPGVGAAGAEIQVASA
jgi:6,7-dimethyl-8-ribityllumazine synthase